MSAYAFPLLFVSIILLAVGLYTFLTNEKSNPINRLFFIGDDIFRMVPEAVFFVNLDGVIKRVNDKAVELTGYRENELVDAPFQLVLDAAAVEKLTSALKLPDKPQSAEFETVVTTKKAGKLPISLKYETIRRKKNQLPAGIIALCKNLTFEKQVEEEFKKTEKIKTIGHLAGGIAHDFNNLLSIIMTHVAMMKKTETISEKMNVKLDRIYNAALLAVNLTRQLAALSKETKPRKEICSIIDILQTAVDLALSGSIVQYRLNASSDLHAINADKAQLMQAFLNLFINSCQAMPEGGTITISCRDCLKNNRHWIEIAIADEGKGMEPDTLKNIFNPFFTTKAKGSGLGLTVVQTIIGKHEGTVAVTSNPGAGTTFTILLPAFVQETEFKHIPRVSFPEQHNRRILVMDDEDAIRAALYLMLSQNGHTVVHAANGTEAIQTFLRYKSEGAPFDLAILDLAIPNDFVAKEVIIRIKEIDPLIPALLITGYRDDPVLTDYKSHGFIGALLKPFDYIQLNQAVNSALRQH